MSKRPGSPGNDSPLPPPISSGPLLAWLVDTLRPMNRTRVKQLLRHGRVAVNGTPITRFDHPLNPGDRVTLLPVDRERSRLPILHEDEAVVVADKPPGLLAVASESEKTDTAFTRLKELLRDRRAGRPFVVHRLDRETSGLLLFAKSAEVRDQLQANWAQIEKTYLAVVEGQPDPASGVIENFLFEGRDLQVRAGNPGGEGKRAITRYRCVRTRGPFALVEVGLETGRKHQIRVHLAGLGTPVIGDRLYGTRASPAGRLGLHAWRLAFAHPVSGRRLELESPLPEALQRLIER